MQYYFAPMEGLTDRVYRRLHHQYYPGIDRYYMPFISPTVHRSLTPREILELPVTNTVTFTAIPQLLTKSPDDFIWASEQCKSRGYHEINLNVGCPSGTVVSKGKGAGMLADPEFLDCFLDKIYSLTSLPVSIKTRIGFSSPDELPDLIEIYNRYPVAELIVHPRVRQDFYHSEINLDAFEYVLKNSKNPICYNGNLCSADAAAHFMEKYPSVRAVMLGRGLIGNPGMLSPGGTTRENLQAFSSHLLDSYLTEFGGSRNAMFRMKEHWRYLIHLFDKADKLHKQLRKATGLDEYRHITAEIFNTLPMKDNLTPDW